jgi:hypothetical protein
LLTRPEREDDLMRDVAPATTVANLRALRARRQVRLLDIATRLQKSPSELSLMLNNQIPMPIAVADLVRREILRGGDSR